MFDRQYAVDCDYHMLGFSRSLSPKFDIPTSLWFTLCLSVVGETVFYQDGRGRSQL